MSIISGLLVSGSAEKIEYMQMPRAANNLVGIIYVKFDNINGGDYFKRNL